MPPKRHAVWDIKYHVVDHQIRYKVLRGEVAERARDLLRQISAAREVRTLTCVAPVYAVIRLCRRMARAFDDPCGPIVLVRFTPSLGPRQ